MSAILPWTLGLRSRTSGWGLAVELSFALKDFPASFSVIVSYDDTLHLSNRDAWWSRSPVSVHCEENHPVMLDACGKCVEADSDEAWDVADALYEQSGGEAEAIALFLESRGCDLYEATMEAEVTWALMEEAFKRVCALVTSHDGVSLKKVEKTLRQIEKGFHQTHEERD